VELDYDFAFESNMIVGDFVNPVIIALSQTNNDEVITYANKMSVYPNPFNPVTTIEYQLATAGQVRIEIYNIKGQKVTELLNKEQDAGNYTFNWDAAGMNSGIYFIRLSCGEYRKTSKVLLLK
jgi:flagellar hook assembly protein FlgD